MLVALAANVLPTITDPIAFTCAAIAVVGQSETDRPVPATCVARAIPYQVRDTTVLPPSFFHLVHHVQNIQRRQVPA